MIAAIARRRWWMRRGRSLCRQATGFTRTFAVAPVPVRISERCVAYRSRGSGEVTVSAPAELGLGERVEKRSCPAVDVMGEHLASQRAHPSAPFLDRLVECRLDRVLTRSVSCGLTR